MKKCLLVIIIILTIIALCCMEISKAASDTMTTMEIQEDTTSQVITTIETTTTTVTTTSKKNTTKSNINYKKGFKGFITHYGPNCKGCSGRTASGYNVKSTIYYNDKEYGKVRIVATSRKIPLYTIIRIPNYKKGSITAIVLDRGVSGNKVDILVDSEKTATNLGIQRNAKVEVLRWGR